ncbi:MAG TPA: amidohydrolase [Bacteroidales bacterium]|nr:amidohydrolase [Bacteroidales bacterium]
MKQKIIISALITIVLLKCGTTTAQEESAINVLIGNEVNRFSERAYNIYVDLHQTPELSLMEFETSSKMAKYLDEFGFDVTTGIGGNGVVGILKNGDGPVILLRTDMDALPIKETTGLEFASTRIREDPEGNKWPVMHACGHDMHMTVWLGAINTLVRLSSEWSGTLIAIAQPAEEVVGGASGMINDGLFKRFPVPDFALCYHVSAELPAGSVGFYPGSIFAGVNSADLTIFGVGGHGAMPHTTIDPIVLSAQTILSLQTIVSREINPVYPAVVTVGSIHGGTKDNIIPEEVTMQLTLRFFDEKVYEKIREALIRIPEGIARAAGLPDDKMPRLILGDHYTPPVTNDPDLINRASASMRDIIGEKNVFRVDPATVAEDFGRYGRTEEQVKIALFWLGTVNPQKLLEANEAGSSIPALHNPGFCPDFYPTFEGGVKAMVRTVIDLYNIR